MKHSRKHSNVNLCVASSRTSNQDGIHCANRYAGYIRLVRATGEGDPDTCMCDAEGDGLESDRGPMDSDTDVRYPVDDFSD